MVHIAPNTKSRIISKGISTGYSKNSYRGLVKIGTKAQNSYTRIEHEASTSRIAEEQLFYLLQRGIDAEEAVSLMVNGFCKEVFNELPLEFASEADRLLSLKLEGSVG
jgi:Fe-S cluster assembly protein SufB